MKKNALRFCLCLVVLLSAACSGEPKHKIGSTIKGERIAILDQVKTLTPDAKANEVTIDLPEPMAVTAWPQAGYDTHHVLPAATFTAAPKKIWSVSIGEGSNSSFKVLARPVFADGVVYAMDSEGRVSAVDVASGKVKWSVETTPEDHDAAIGGGLAVDSDNVYATTGHGDVMALATVTGKAKWQRRLLNPLRAPPTVSDGTVYVVSIDNQLSALDARNGEVKWQHRGITESATLMGASSPAVDANNVVVAYGSGEIYNLRSENGRALWNYSLTTPTQLGALPAIADIRGLPVFDSGRVFAVSHSGRMAAIDQRTGERAWDVDIGGINTPLVAGNAVFVLTNDSQLVALDRERGRVLWVQALQRFTDPDDRSSDALVWTGPVLAGGRLWLVNTEGWLVSFLPLDGKEMSRVEIGAPVSVSPIIVNGVMYVVTDGGELVALK